MSRLKAATELLDAAEVWKEQCLLQGGSLFGEEKLWARNYFNELDRFFVKRPKVGDGGFLKKLQLQLEPASSGAKRLFSEMIWLYWLVSDLRADNKLGKIREVYEWSGESLPKGHWALGELLEKGFVNPGQEYHRAWKGFVFIISVMLKWTGLSRTEQSSLLVDSWGFAEWLDERSAQSSHQFRHALLFLLFPDDFESIVSESKKKEIVKALGQSQEKQPSTRIDLDKAVLAIRRRLEARHGGHKVDFYAEPFKQMWESDGSRMEKSSREQGDLREALEGGRETASTEVKQYSLEEGLRDLLMERTQFRRIVDLLESRKNLILQGPPGVGKSFVAKRVAWILVGRKDPACVQLVQFHQSYSYEDFVQGFRPTERGGFTLRRGVFFELCERARLASERKFVLVIDEINRGNLSRIFGELLMLIEADKRDSEFATVLTYGSADEPFFVPENLYILGLMNTADRSLAIVDYALRRRFAFETLEPAYDTRAFRARLEEEGIDSDLVNRIDKKFSDLNQTIRKDKDLGAGFEIGHSYFMQDQEINFDEDWYIRILDSQIEPLLKEYWFDRPERVKDEMKKLRQ